MKSIHFLISLMEFNKRVLWQGTPQKNIKYTTKELKTLLFFNQVFISNTDEIFEKYNPKKIIDIYVKCLQQYQSNIETILEQASVNNKIELVDEDTFERRYTLETELNNRIITTHFKSLETVKYNFKSKDLYYISLFQDGHVAVSYIDGKMDIYHNPLKFIIDDEIKYFKTDECIRTYINSQLNAIDTVICRVIKNTKGLNTAKIDLSGNIDTIKAVHHMFKHVFDNGSCFINKYLYTNDIDYMISDNIHEVSIKNKQKFVPIDLLKLFKKDSLIEYPIDSFNDYLEFLSSAAQSNEVEKIYVTLYRIGNNPTIFYILKNAVKRGIKVHVNIELCAYGENINKMWMKELRNVGVKVTTYACGELKVHSKLTLIKFMNGSLITQIGTGNYHTKTTTQYTDLSLTTSDENICKQVKQIFDILDGNEDQKFDSDVLVTNYNLRPVLSRLINQETLKGENGYIAIKCNALDDSEVINCLNNAAIAGCRIDLIIRGVCTWIPNQLGNNVRIKSIVWDKLEHSRVFCFGKDLEHIYIGSLDLTTNKLDERIETMVKIKKPSNIVWMVNYINRYITTTTGSWLLQKDGTYIKE